MKLDEVKAGDTIIADGGFPCMRGAKVVEADDKGLFVPCDEGKHYLDGQEDAPGAELVGLSRPASGSTESI